VSPHPDPEPPRSARGFVVARIAGISLTLDPSWLLSLGLLSWISFELIVRDLLRTVELTPAAIVVCLAFGLAISVCIVIHEFSHAFVARAYGLRVRRVTLFMFGGVAQIEQEAPRPSAEFAIALAGPLASIVLATLLAGVSVIIGDELSDGFGVWAMLGFLNLVIAIFNLAPAFPMDGGRLARSILWAVLGRRARATRMAVFGGRAFAVLLIGWGLVVLGTSSFADFSGAYTVMIGAFLYSAAGSAGKTEGGEHPNQSPRALPLPGIPVSEDEDQNVLTGPKAR